MTELSIRSIRETEISEFRKLALEEIGDDYPDIDESFADNIIQAHENETDPIGYFTKTKTIWAGEVNDETVGYLVGTEKRGGSVKFSPILIKEDYRNQGHGTALWQTVEEHYRTENHRKVYTHAPWFRKRLFRWFARLGYHLEGILAEQYDQEQDEFVVGKFLESAPTTVLDLPRPSGINDGSNKEFDVRRFEDADTDAFVDLISEQMVPFYNEVNTEFAERILEARERFDRSYKAKGKAIFVVEHGNDLVGCCVGSPKRGGSVKLVPLLFADEATRPMVQDLLGHTATFFANQDYRKVYSMVPHLQTDLLEILRQNGFTVEGFIRAPYKPGIDNVFVGKFLQEA